MKLDCTVAMELSPSASGPQAGWFGGAACSYSATTSLWRSGAGALFVSRHPRFVEALFPPPTPCQRAFLGVRFGRSGVSRCDLQRLRRDAPRRVTVDQQFLHVSRKTSFRQFDGRGNAAIIPAEYVRNNHFGLLPLMQDYALEQVTGDE